jgi:hydroxymethylbilane synthase
MTKTLYTSQTLAIGVFMHPWTKAQGIYAQHQLKESAETDTILAYYPYKRELTQALLNGTIQIVCTALRDLPTTLPIGIVIGALSVRFPVSNCLVIAPNALDNTQLFSLKLNAKVWVNAPINKAQLLAFRPDLDIHVTDTEPLDNYKLMIEGKYDACLLTSSIVPIFDIDESKYKIITFSPKEFIPEAGQGVVAYLVAESDVPTRRILKQLHHPAVAQVTNVERKIKRLFNDENIAAYCEKDAFGNFHIRAVTTVDNQLKTIRLSQSTSFDLAENCRAQLV